MVRFCISIEKMNLQKINLQIDKYVFLFISILLDLKMYSSQKNKNRFQYAFVYNLGFNKFELDIKSTCKISVI